jgi:hypothetical protein
MSRRRWCCSLAALNDRKIAKWRATDDEDGHYSFAVAL